MDFYTEYFDLLILKIIHQEIQFLFGNDDCCDDIGYDS